ncbi:hypothetical protein M413DRAFT_255383 [Hebeloma cylindrosporum]|uniref:Uncharacterized protein n=1 Tax=Hebeloma cylindrosporum TaxID=76867 RepID=A0A0C2XIY2_HEBCY|nr:hypothetical protein M413DRAFT_255383 [Hebeloma cylindrosporum h7]
MIVYFPLEGFCLSIHGRPILLGVVGCLRTFNNWQSGDERSSIPTLHILARISNIMKARQGRVHTMRAQLTKTAWICEEWHRDCRRNPGAHLS